ncbi:MAG: hypothetical protein Kow0062_00900 [Acidobacteriota bacterium]
MALLGLALVAWGAWGALWLAPEPRLALSADRAAIGVPGTAFEASADGMVVRGDVLVRLEIEQDGRSETLAEAELHGPSTFRFWQRAEPRRATLRARAARGEPDWLAEGTARVRLVAERPAGLLRGSPVVELVREYPVRFRPPRLEVLSATRAVRQGGAGAARLRVDDQAVAVGVRAGEEMFAAWPAPEGADDERVVVWGVPWTLRDAAQVVAFAEDAAGNRVELPLVDRVEPRRIRRDRIDLPESFLARVVPAILAQVPERDPGESLLDDYLFINRELRQRNRDFLRTLAGRSAPGTDWRDGFAQLPNSKRMAGFAEDRTYYFRGAEVDRQTHLGLDVASVRHAEVPAAAPGTVLFAGFLGIYGNLVVLDHGYGVLTGYAHLSRIDVTEGQRVERGEVLGRTGRTGLAGGDHLHFGVFVGGLPVDPIEWMDRRWIATRILPHVEARRPDRDGAGGA